LIILIILGKVRIMQSCSFLHPPVTSLLFSQNIFLSTILKHPHSMKNPVLFDVTPYSSCKNRRFGGR
jgi:hypothetical protein